ncbi:MAG: HAD hydrolase family protein [Muribaculaceae bacterium]|nr:HAD hydrolase family protein [Muribaculaceae bacterium]
MTDMQHDSNSGVPCPKDLKLFLTDVDGTLTDGGMYYGSDGTEFKKFNTRDGMGLQMLQRSGVKVGIVTSENVAINENRARKLGLDYLKQGARDGGKLAATLEICEEMGISLRQVAYIGDDVNCYDLLSAAGWAACPADACEKVKTIPGIRVLERRGGDACVREWIDMILAKR